ncbi:MAG: hypothetical protein HY248_03115, partial [Fimbriimonas ginsengisoli]|nr:hypothetical protein [Fimbriimonas ginsengisoli]
ENVAVASPDADAAYLRLPRKALSLGSFVGLAASGRDEGAGYGKPLELVGDWGGPLGSAAGFLVQARWQRIRRNYDPIYSREVVQAAVGLRPIPISRNLDVTLRADSAGYSGGGTNFAWARGLAGLSWRPSKHLWLALAGTTSSESGAALFPADQLPVKRSLAGRVDVAFGGFRLSLLNKVDPSTHVRFDREYSVSQVIGCAEVYSQFRRSPNEYKIGLRLRLESFFDALQSRKTRRKGEAAPP